MTCSQRSCVPKARTPSPCVTVLAPHASVSIETETTQRIDSPKPTLLFNRVHHFGQNFLSGQVLRTALVPGALDNFAPEALNLGPSAGPEVVVQCLARFELLAF